eukprot:3485791-Prymnesium_polylepis.1
MASDGAARSAMLDEYFGARRAHGRRPARTHCCRSSSSSTTTTTPTNPPRLQRHPRSPSPYLAL